MALILSGLARCGAWGCFDEFNRLQDSTLSAISMLIQPLQTALKEQKREVCLMEENVRFSSSFYTPNNGVQLLTFAL